jgi:hypothetical protein
MPRFVILRHETPPGRGRRLHWDLMLESGGVLRTWALAKEPTIGASIAAELLPDHRLAYLDYEGPVSGDRGTVERWDCGEYIVREESSDRVAVELTGARIRGIAVVERCTEAPADRWTFSWRPG